MQPKVTAISIIKEATKKPEFTGMVAFVGSPPGAALKVVASFACALHNTDTFAGPFH